MLFILTLFHGNDALAEEEWVDWGGAKVVDANKNWTIKLNKSFDPSTVTEQSVYVKDKNNHKIQRNYVMITKFTN